VKELVDTNLVSTSPSPTFQQLLAEQHPSHPPFPTIPYKLLALDPGETVGWAVFEMGQLTKCGHAAGDATTIEDLVAREQPSVVVMEEYRIYPWRLKQHSLSNVPTLRLIGALQYILQTKGIPYHMQTAQQAKGFATDQRLKQWGMYPQKLRHARDAVRHAVYYLLFTAPKSVTP
jgi:hypothetical protein